MLQHESEGNRRLRTSCDFCIQSKTRCNKEKPSCRRCVRRGHPCIYSIARRAGRPRRSSQATDGGRGLNSQSRESEQQGPPDWTISTSACLCQQHSGNFMGLDEGCTNFVLSDAATTARNEEIMASPRLDFDLHIGSTFGSGLLRNDTLSSIDNGSNYPFDMFQNETEESVAGHYAFTSDDITTQDSLDSMVTSPVNTQSLPTDSASLRTNKEHERNAQQPTRRSDGAVFFSFSDVENAFCDESTFAELKSMIHFIVDNGKGDSGTAVYPVNHLHDSCFCFCSTATNKLLSLVSHPALSRQSSRLPLDIAFFFENFIYEIYESVSKCLVCRTKSLHSWAFLCITTDWVVEILRNVVQSISSTREAQDASPLWFDGVVDSSIIRVGRLDLDGHLQGLCTRSLIEHRLNRLVLTMEKMSKKVQEWRGAALQQTVRIMMQEIHHKIESILGMMEL